MERDFEYYKKKLLLEKQSILEKIEKFNDKGYGGLGHSLRDSTGELSNYDNHPADSGSDLFEREKDLGLRENSKMILRMINDALDKIESGHYGHCDSCGEEIVSERLEVMPYSTFCRECKEQSELTRSGVDRPLEQAIHKSMHERVYLDTDGTDNNSYDGEDTLEELERYGSSNTPSDNPGMINYKDDDVDDYGEYFEIEDN